MTTAELILGAGVAIMGGGNIWNWLASRGKTRVDLIQLGQTISAEIITALKAERDELAAKVDSLERQVRDLQHDIRGWFQWGEAQERLLIEKGITPPPRPKRKGPTHD